MKRLVSIILILLFSLSLVSCNKQKKGPTEVDYGEVYYALYKDEEGLTFEYLSCFKKTEMEEDDFVTYTDDKLGVLTYQVYSPDNEQEHNDTLGYDKPSRSYAEIAAFTDEEAESYMRLALGMVSSQGAKYTVDDFAFEKLENEVRLRMEVTAEYERSGEIQKLWMFKVVKSDERVYTLHAFAPASIVTKYGPAYRNVVVAG